MRLWPRRFRLYLFLAAVTGIAATPSSAQTWKAPVAMKTLPNGLKVVVSEDHSAPTFGVCVSYGIGFRLEPKGEPVSPTCSST